MRKLFIISLTFLLISSFSKLSAQQDPLYSQFMFNNLSINPGYAGTSGYLSIRTFSRHQWIGFDGAPQTQSLSIHAPLKNGLGLGLFVERDVIGPVNNINIKGNIAYRLKLGDNSRLSFGIMAGTSSTDIGLNDISTNSKEDIAFQSNIKKTKPVLGTGFRFYGENGFFSASIPNLIETKFETKDITWTHSRHYYLSGGYTWRVNKDLFFRPTAMLRYVKNAPVSAEISGSFIISEKIWLGGMYRFDNAVGALASIQINKQLRIGYAYDLSLREVSSYQSGTHEIMVGYDFNFGKDNFISPKFF